MAAGEAFAVGRNLNAAESERIPVPTPPSPGRAPAFPPALSPLRSARRRCCSPAAALVHALRQRYAPQAAAYAKQKAELDAGYAAAMRNGSPPSHRCAHTLLGVGKFERRKPALGRRSKHPAPLRRRLDEHDVPDCYYARAGCGVVRLLRAQEVRQVLERVLAVNPSHAGRSICTYICWRPTPRLPSRTLTSWRGWRWASHLVHAELHLHAHRSLRGGGGGQRGRDVAPRPGIDSDHVYPLHNREFLVIRANPPRTCSDDLSSSRADRCGRFGSRAGARRR